jgi:hypothetical protein
MQEINVGHLDSVIRIILGVVCLGLIGYYFFGKRFMPIYLLIPVIILVPFFLKTGITKVCPIMKAAHISTTGKS